MLVFAGRVLLKSSGRRTIQFEQLTRNLAKNGFYSRDALKDCFDKVDLDRSGSLELSEVGFGLVTNDLSLSLNFSKMQYFALVYTWTASKQGGISTFFSCPENSNIVEQAMFRLFDAMKKYDIDRSLRLSRSESDNLFQDLLPSYVSVYKSVAAELVQVDATIFVRSQKCLDSLRGHPQSSGFE